MYIHQIHIFLNILNYLYSILVVDFLLSALMLISLRLVVKWIFGLLSQNGSDQAAVIIYGVGESGSITYNAVQSKYRVLAFVDDDRNKQGKRFFAVNIQRHPPEKIQAVMQTLCKRR